MGMLSGAFAAYGSNRVTLDQNDAYISLGKSFSHNESRCTYPMSGKAYCARIKLIKAVSGLLTLLMGYRFNRGRKFMPAGLSTSALYILRTDVN